jgi:hypothetical protein
MFLAHGVGTRADLPVSATPSVVGAGLVLVISFVALAMLWRRPKFTGGKTGWPLPTRVQRVLDAPALRMALQGLSLVAVVLVCIIGLGRTASCRAQHGTVGIYIIFWVGLVPASLLL